MRRGWMGAAVAALALACGGGEKSGGEGPKAPLRDAGVAPETPTGGNAGGIVPTGVPVTTPAPVDCDGRVSLLVKGVRPTPSPYSSFRIDIDDIAAEPITGTTSLTVQDPASGIRELVRDGAVTVGSIQIPDGFTDLVRVRVTLSQVSIEGGSVDADLDIETAPLTFYVDPAAVAPGRCHAVLHLDLARSIEPDLPSGLLFLPRYSLHY